jgi:hypothetical protein
MATTNLEIPPGNEQIISIDTGFGSPAWLRWFTKVTKFINSLGGGVNEISITSGTTNPNTGTGVDKPIGSLRTNSITGQLWKKTGAGNTSWTEVT